MATREIKEETRGRKHKFAGKFIKVVHSKFNPRRRHSRARASFELMKDGMPYERYVAIGGRPKDLIHCVNKNYVEMVDAI